MPYVSVAYGICCGTVQKLGVKAGSPTGRQPHERRNPYAPFIFRGTSSPGTPNFWTVPAHDQQAVASVGFQAAATTSVSPEEGRRCARGV
jgi:hypothetical protein